MSAADRLADLRRWVDATGADEDVRERAVAMLAGVLPTPEECERLEAIAADEEARAELRESSDLAYDEWAKVATNTGVPPTYKQGA